MNAQYVHDTIAPQRQALLRHPLYRKIRSIEDLHGFLEIHVFAVWDFMSLLKGLQQKLTCTDWPWFATEHPQTRYFVNEIVLGEESDLAADGRRLSHFEMYLEAMTACGADTSEIRDFIGQVRSLDNVFVAIRSGAWHPKVKEFLEFTFDIVNEGQPHKIASAFTFGREDLIPDMFTEILRNFETRFPETDLAPLRYYFERHIELDAGEHGPMSMQMMAELCDTPKKWQEAAQVAQTALEKRMGLWEAIEQRIAADATA